MKSIFSYLACGLMYLLLAGHAAWAQPVIFDVSPPAEVGKDERLEGVLYGDNSHVYYTASLNGKDDMLHVRRLALSTLAMEDVYSIPKFTFVGSEVVPLDGLDNVVDEETGTITFFATAVSKATRRLQLYGQVRTLAGKEDKGWKLIGEASYRASKKSKIRYSVNPLQEGNYTAYFFAEENDTLNLYTMEVSTNLEAHPSKKVSLGFNMDDFKLLGLRRYHDKLYCYVKSARGFQSQTAKRALLRVDMEKPGIRPDVLEVSDPGLDLSDNTSAWDLKRGRFILAGGSWNPDTKCTDGLYTQIVDLDKFAVLSLEKHPFTVEEGSKTSLPPRKPFKNVTTGQFPGFTVERMQVLEDGEIQLEYFSMGIEKVDNFYVYNFRGINLARFDKAGRFRWIAGIPRHMPLAVTGRQERYLSNFKDGKCYIVYWGHAVDMEPAFEGTIHPDDERWTMMTCLVDGSGNVEKHDLFVLNDRTEIMNWRYVLSLALRISPTEYVFNLYPAETKMQFGRIKLK